MEAGSHWKMRARVSRDAVTQVCRASENSAMEQHGIMCRLRAAASAETASCVRKLTDVLASYEGQIKPTRPDHGDHFGDKIKVLKNTRNFSLSLLGAKIFRMY
ncbi:hypothetical protein AVEN_230986-1 [Araneus ventricosus]|uniref:Uncharacterized protein n=1 Tax=Araneus ventricosus TaxID=182803 RepID=A0A4Y2A499_ARAVE|nr:hypothetical protein AVEN_230986-1 [Araneus ventricosus]